MVRVGEGKVRILHSIIWKPYGKSGELFGFGGCDAYGWSVRNTNHEVTRPIKVYKLDEKCFYSHQIVMTKRFKQDKWEYQNLMGLEFTTYRDSFSYEVGSLDKGAPRGGCYIGNNGHNGDMPEWEYIRRFYGIGPRLERVHFLEEERYNDYVEWRDLHDQPKLGKCFFATDEEYEEYLEKRWEVDPEILQDVLTEKALVSRGIFFGWQLYRWLVDGLETDNDGEYIVHSSILFEKIANTPASERPKWMDEMAFYLWTVYDDYPKPDKKTSKTYWVEEHWVGQDHDIYEECKEFHEVFLDWWRNEHNPITNVLDNEGNVSEHGKLRCTVMILNLFIYLYIYIYIYIYSITSFNL